MGLCLLFILFVDLMFVRYVLCYFVTLCWWLVVLGFGLLVCVDCLRWVWFVFRINNFKFITGCLGCVGLVGWGWFWFVLLLGVCLRGLYYRLLGWVWCVVGGFVLTFVRGLGWLMLARHDFAFRYYIVCWFVVVLFIPFCLVVGWLLC